MARTTTRTQMIAGMMLHELAGFLFHLEEMEPATVGDRTEAELKKDPEWMKARNIVMNLLEREMKKNVPRREGASTTSLDEINEIIMTEA